MTTRTSRFERLDPAERVDIGRRAQQPRRNIEMAFRHSGMELTLDAPLERLQTIRADTEQLERLVAAHLPVLPTPAPERRSLR